MAEDVVINAVSPDNVVSFGTQTAKFPQLGLFQRDMDLLQPPSLGFWGSNVVKLPDCVKRQWVADVFFTKQIPVSTGGAATPLGSPIIFRDYRISRWLEWRIAEGPINWPSDKTYTREEKIGYTLEQKTKVESTLALDLSATQFGLTAKYADTLKITTENNQTWTMQKSDKQDYALKANTFYIFWGIWDIMLIDYFDYFISQDDQKHFFTTEATSARIDCQTKTDIGDSLPEDKLAAVNAMGRTPTISLEI